MFFLDFLISKIKWDSCLNGEVDVGIVVVDEGGDRKEEGNDSEQGKHISLGKCPKWKHIMWVHNFDDKFTKIKLPVIEHGKSLYGPHEQLVARQLAPQAGEPGKLAGAVALELLVQNLGGAEAVVVLDGPLQRRLGEGFVLVVLVTVK